MIGVIHSVVVKEELSLCEGWFILNAAAVNQEVFIQVWDVSDVSFVDSCLIFSVWWVVVNNVVVVVVVVVVVDAVKVVVCGHWRLLLRLLLLLLLVLSDLFTTTW